MQLLVQLEGDYLRTQILLKIQRLAGGEQEVAGEREELGWAGEEAAVAAAEAPKVGVEEVVVGQEEVGLLLKTELGQGAGEVEEEVQGVLGQHPAGSEVQPAERLPARLAQKQRSLPAQSLESSQQRQG